MPLDFSVVLNYWPVLLKGLALTLAFTGICALMGSLLGFVISMLRQVKTPLVRLPLTLYVEFFRGTPLLIQLFWVFFCFPVVFGLDIPPYVSVLISLTLFMGAMTPAPPWA